MKRITSIMLKLLGCILFVAAFTVFDEQGNPDIWNAITLASAVLIFRHLDKKGELNESNEA